jgi:membrane protease YdiL (CAAX protease family)
MATSQFLGQGVSALIPALVYAFLQTAFSEELFFRGFLTKGFINKFGFQLGNTIQSLLFGFMHSLMFISKAGLLGTIIIILLTGMVGWLMGWINEKQSNGSIISSWLLHGCANTLASIIAMFNII